MADHQVPDARTALFRAGILLLLFTGISGILYLLFGDQLEEAGEWLSRTLGYPGVFLFVYLIDTFIVPATGDIVFFFTREWDPAALLTVLSAASISGGFCGFLIGKFLVHLPWVHEMTSYYRKRGSRLIERYGIWAVALAAFTPLPYSTISWIAGMLGLPSDRYLLASLLRIPRFILYYLAIRGSTEILETIF